MALPTPHPTLLDVTPAQARSTLESWVSAQGLPRYRADQLLRRLWVAPAERWADATELPATLRAELDQVHPLPRLEPDVVQQSSDGTRKYLWRLADGEAVESVLIPSGSRRTLCISSQAGCALRCAFCATGLMGYRRNLTPFEVAGQVREILLRNPDEKPTNIVYMGMGEPLLNWPAVDATLSILNHPDGFGIGARHITVSTVGILPGMAEFAKRPEQFRLAISLHAPTSAQRLAMMPIEKKYDLESVLKAAEAFRKRVTFEYVMIGGVNDSDADAAQLARRPEQFRLAISRHATTRTQRRSIMPIEKKYDLEAVLKAAEVFRKRVTFEYVMIAGVNDADTDADRLAKLARRLGALVNILPLHPGGAPDLMPTALPAIRRFADRLRNQGIEATVRRSRGLDINAACGQLRVAVEEKRVARTPVS